MKTPALFAICLSRPIPRIAAFSYFGQDEAENPGDLSLSDLASEQSDFLISLASWTAEAPIPWVIAELDGTPGTADLVVTELRPDLESLISSQLGPDHASLAALATTILAHDEAALNGPGETLYDRAYRLDTGETLEETEEWFTAENSAKESLAAAGITFDWNTLRSCISGSEFLPLAARHLIDENTPWNQAAYDYLTQPWRTTIGALHPDDAPIENLTGQR